MRFHQYGPGVKTHFFRARGSQPMEGAELQPRRGLLEGRLVFPAAMEPEILRRILADEFFECGRISLGQDADVISSTGKIGWVHHIFAAYLIAETRTNPAPTPTQTRA